MRILIALIAAACLFVSSAQAEQVCVKKKLKVGRNGTINLQRALKVSELCAANQLPLFDTTQLQGPPGSTGPQGVAGPFVDTLPSGRTVRGRFRVGGQVGSTAHNYIAFPFPLAQAPTLNWVIDSNPNNANCPGTGEEPEAAPGHFCLYTSTALSNNWSTILLGNIISRFGFPLQVSGSGAGSFHMGGSWAVTAP